MSEVEALEHNADSAAHDIKGNCDWNCNGAIFLAQSSKGTIQALASPGPALPTCSLRFLSCCLRRTVLKSSSFWFL